MRADLETAIGVALTSREASDLVRDSPAELGAWFDLDPAEVAALSEMASDLVTLMPGFVLKRERGLRRSLHTTLQLLGPEATPLVEDFVEACAPLDTFAADVLAFADFVVAETEKISEEIPHGRILAQLARFERLRMRAFGTVGPLWPSLDADPLDARHLAADRVLWRHPSAHADAFDWDLRTLRRPDDLARMRPDPSVLLCFQWGDHGAGRVLRLDDGTARALEIIGERSGSVTVAEVCASVAADVSPEALLGKLVDQGVVTGSAP